MTEEQKGSEDSLVKNFSITPSITALLKPTTEYLGLELRDYFKENIEGWKAKCREQNLKAHLDAVREKLAEHLPPKAQAGPSFSQLALFDEWMEKAQNIDPEDKDLSEIWRNLLAKAARGDTIPNEVVAALKSLSPGEAQFLFEKESTLVFSLSNMVRISLGMPGMVLGALNTGMPFNIRTIPFSVVRPKGRYLVSSLQAKGIVERDYSYMVYFMIMLGMVIASLVASELVQFENNPSAKLMFVMLSSFFVVVGLVSGMGLWRLTWLGRELLAFVTSHSRRQSAGDTQ